MATLHKLNLGKSGAIGNSFLSSWRAPATAWEGWGRLDGHGMASYTQLKLDRSGALILSSLREGVSRRRNPENSMADIKMDCFAHARNDILTLTLTLSLEGEGCGGLANGTFSSPYP